MEKDLDNIIDNELIDLEGELEEDELESEVNIEMEEISDTEETVVKNMTEALFDKYKRMQDEGLKKKKSARVSQKGLSELIGERDILPIDDEVKFETKASKYLDTVQEIVTAMNNNLPLTGIITSSSSYVINDTKVVTANIMYGPVKVIIPLPFLMDIRESTNPDRERGEAYAKLLVNQRIGAEIDFIVREFDEKELVATASRIDAMKLKREAYFFRKKRGKYIINEGDEVEARVCCATKQDLFLEVFGQEITIPMKNVTYRRINSVHDVYQPGDRLPVTITKLERTVEKLARGEKVSSIRLNVSTLQSETDPRDIYLRQINVGDTMQGTMVTMANKNYYVNPIGIDMDIPCVISDEFRIKPVKGDKVLITISAKDVKTKRIRGYIVRVL